MSAVLRAQEASARYQATVTPPLVQQFDLLATAPGGVKRLRDLILTLAVQGKLVPQDPMEEPAHVLLGRIESGNIVGPRRKTTRSASNLAQFGANDPPYELPENWAWAQFEQVADIASNLVSPSAHLSAWQVAPDCIEKGSGRLLQRRSVAEAGVKSANHLFTPGQLLYSKIRPSLSKAVRVDFAGLCSADMYPVDAHIDPDYLLLYILSQPFLAQVSIAENRVKMPKLNQDSLNGFLVAVPPLLEQARIVARVDELMRLCDALEAKGRLEAEHHQQLLTTLLGTLTDSRTPEELAANWQRVADHFDLLLDRPAAVDALEQAILHLAVRGRLVPQSTADEPASAMLIASASSRKANAAEKLADIIDADLPFEVPQGWAWAHFNQLIDPAKPISYGVLVPGPETPGGVPFVRIADLSIEAPPHLPEKTIAPEVDAQYRRTRLEGGEILMGVVGSIGKLGVAPSSWAGANIARAVCRIVPTAAVEKSYVLLLLQSEFMQSNFTGDTRTLAQPTLNVGLIRNALTPVPPRAEQARIVTRVDQLRQLCRDLRQRLSASQAVQAHLADALVENAATA